MAVNRLLYLGILILSAVFYFASSLWASWLLLALVLAAPIASLLASLPAMLSCRLEAKLPDTVEQGESAGLHLALNSWHFPPLPEAQIRMNLRTRDREKDIRYLSRLSRADGVLTLKTDACGFLAPDFRRGRVYDALGLVGLPMRLPKLAPMAILPAAQKPDPMPQMEHFLHLQMRAKPGGGYSELYDNRGYHPGDPIKNIHWKLSLKTDELIVREPMEPVYRRVVLALHTPRGAQMRAESIGSLRWLCSWMLDNGVKCKVVWMDGETLQHAELATKEDALQILRAVCLVPENSAALPWPLPIEADWACPVGREGGADA